MTSKRIYQVTATWDGGDVTHDLVAAATPIEAIQKLEKHVGEPLSDVETNDLGLVSEIVNLL